jgi:Coenzyme PQQ synthesis protein D (PqqD)
MMRPVEFFPEARKQGIISKEADDELLVYDLKRDLAHCLNPSAAAVWKLSDGRTSVNQISQILSKQTGHASDESIVWLALSELRRAHLLEEDGSAQLNIATMFGMTRREAIRRIGVGAAIVLPVVISITAPTPAEAGSCLTQNAPCSTSAECCSMACVLNVCA